MNRSLALALLLIAPTALFAQTAATPQDGPWQSFLANLRPRNVGPTNMSGRITDLAVYNKEPRIFYVATASGGLWKTINGGTTISPVFDKAGTVSLGAVAVSQKDPNLVWIGSGEATSRNSVAWGDGVYKSTDGGKTWTNMGLKETMHIARVLIDPNDNNTVYIGALGRTWGYNTERGVYKTTDGGKTWKQILYVDDKTGVGDMVMNPKNPKEMLVSMWQHIRKPYDFASGGFVGGIYKTTDGGSSWKKVSKGLPSGWPKLETLTDAEMRRLANYLSVPFEGEPKAADLLPKVKEKLGNNPLPVGRIGLSYFYKDPKVVLATVESSAFVTTQGTALNPNSSGTFLSKDGGESWVKTSNTNPRPFYFSRPLIDPQDSNRQYLGAVSLYVADDGKTFRSVQANVHADIHALWINPEDPYHILLGCDGGVYQSRDRGATWSHLNNMPIGQFYAVCFDMRKPYWVYGGLQDNGSWGQPTQHSRGSASWFDTWSLGGGDGFHVASDPSDWRWFYSESQGGGIIRYDLQTGNQRNIRPRTQGLRFNWSTPFMLSPHNPATIYIGSNRLYKSVNRGDTWNAVSPDLSTNDPAKLRVGVLSVSPENTGAEVHCSIITMSESPRQQGVIYVGTDDGLVQVTRNDGVTWENVTANIPDLPANTWCSRVLASKHSDGRVYATFDGHRSNDFKPYAYVSEDYGKTWSKLDSGLPDNDSVYVICEGEKNPDLLFLGSEMSLRVSLDRGKSWSRFRSGDFPTVAVHDLVIHPREGDLLIATHGRAIYTMDVNGLEAMTSDSRDKDVVVARPQNVYVFPMTPGNPWDGDAVYTVPNTQPGTLIQYYLKADASSGAKITVANADGSRNVTVDGPAKAGLNVVRWAPRRQDLAWMTPGEYRVTVTVGGKDYTTSVRVEKADPS